jgi:hypothetical protein
MAWETRNGQGRYYTRSRRVGGRVVREYLGTGEVAELAARMDAIDRAAQERDRARKRQAKATEDARDTELQAVCEAGLLWSRVALLAAGYHRHDRGEWRRRRGQR